MNEELDSSELSLPISDLLEIDRICRAFEAAWNAGQHPEVEEFLGVTPEPQRNELLKELLALQTELDGGSAAATPDSTKQTAAERLSHTKPGLKQFTRRLIQSGLMTADECRAFYRELPADRRPQTAEQFAQELYAAGKLTRFQAQAVYQGKTRGLVLGNYIVLDKLGQGGMGYVYKAQHRKMKRVVALKLLPATATRTVEAVRRFEREVEAAAKLAHPNIVTAYDADEAPGVHFLVMEYVEGTDLGRIVEQKGRLDVSAAVDYVCQAARGLDYAHRQGIVHRDIKPSNLLLDEHGTIKILDMGLARIAQEGQASEGGPEPTGSAPSSTSELLGEDQLTQDGQLVGTCQYMAPEQAQDARSADQRSDVYSLGCTLYKLLVGRPPYESRAVAEVILAHREAPIPSLRNAQPDVPAELDAVFQRMVAKQPDQRQPSMAEVIAELEKYSSPGEARGGTAASQTASSDECSDSGRTPPQNRRILVGVAPVVVVIVLGIIVWRAMSGQKMEVAVRSETKSAQQPATLKEQQPATPSAIRESEPALTPAQPSAQENGIQPSQAPGGQPSTQSPGNLPAANRAAEPPTTPASKPTPADTRKPVHGSSLPSPERAGREAESQPVAAPRLAVPFARASSPQQSPLLPSSRQRLPVPEGAVLEQATQTAGALFHMEIEKAKTADEKTALAQRLLTQALDGTVDAAGRYVLTRMAASLAVAARDAETAFQCVDQLDAAFDVDPFAMKTAILAGWAKDAQTPPARKQLIEQMLVVGDEAMDVGNADAAKELGRLATAKASGLRDKDLTQRLKEYRERLAKAGRNLEELREAQASLAKDPQDPQANLVVGQYFCFTKGDWQKGLPLLAVGSDERLKGLAEREISVLSHPPSATGMPAAPSNPQSPIPNPLELADGWWAVADTDRRGRSNRIKIHAGQWYRQVSAALPPGLVRNNVEKRLA
jgi:serine/threonine protein kinase